MTPVALVGAIGESDSYWLKPTLYIQLPFAFQGRGISLGHSCYYIVHLRYNVDEYPADVLQDHPRLVDIPSCHTKRLSSTFIVLTAKVWKSLPASVSHTFQSMRK